MTLHFVLAALAIGHGAWSAGHPGMGALIFLSVAVFCYRRLVGAASR